jgi:hypothetical protein
LGGTDKIDLSGKIAAGIPFSMKPFMLGERVALSTVAAVVDAVSTELVGVGGGGEVA